MNISIDSPDAVVRMLSRAVIRRVQIEHPTCDKHELISYISAANPFRSDQTELQSIWQEELNWSLMSYGCNLN